MGARAEAPGLPDGVDEGRLKAALYDEYRIEVPMHRWNGQPLVRMSFHAHTGREAVDALLDALPVLLGRFA